MGKTILFRAMGSHAGAPSRAGRWLVSGLEDANGGRSIELASVAAGGRYTVGKGEGCDIIANGALCQPPALRVVVRQGSDGGSIDVGSTNGIRVESANGTIARSTPGRAGVTPPPADRTGVGGMARAVGANSGRCAAIPATFVAIRPPPPMLGRTRASVVAPPTPVTPITPPRRRDGVLTITARMASGFANDRRCRGRASLSRRPLAQPDAGHRLGPRRGLGSAFRDRGARRVRSADHRAWRQRRERRRHRARAGDAVHMEAWTGAARSRQGRVQSRRAY